MLFSLPKKAEGSSFRQGETELCSVYKSENRTPLSLSEKNGTEFRLPKKERGLG